MILSWIFILVEEPPTYESLFDGAQRSGSENLEIQLQRSECSRIERQRSESGEIQLERLECSGIERERSESGEIQLQRSESPGFERERSESLSGIAYYKEIFFKAGKFIDFSLYLLLHFGLFIH